MAVQVYYCNQCGIKISPQEMEKVKAFEFKGSYYCKKCFSRMSKSIRKKILLYMKEEKKRKENLSSSSSKKVKKISKSFESEHKEQTSSADLPTLVLKEVHRPYSPPQKSSLWLWTFLGIFLILLFSYFLFFSSSPKKTA